MARKTRKKPGPVPQFGERIPVYVSKKLRDAIKVYATRQGMKEAEMVRRLLDTGLRYELMLDGNWDREPESPLSDVWLDQKITNMGKAARKRGK